MHNLFVSKTVNAQIIFINDRTNVHVGPSLSSINSELTDVGTSQNAHQLCAGCIVLLVLKRTAMAALCADVNKGHQEDAPK